MNDKKTALITGVTGQDGMYLCDLLLGKGYDVFGLVRHVSNESPRVSELRSKGVRIIYGDMTDASSLVRAVKESSPDEVYNLAAQSFVGDSFEQAALTANVDGLGVLYLLEAVRITGTSPRILQASTSEMFGKVQEIPQTERTPFYPRSPYGCAKLYAFWLCKLYREAYGMYVCNSICFNHESPLRGGQFVTRKITRGVADIIRGCQRTMRLGNIDAQRDWGSAIDYVEAMHSMLQLDTSDDYVISTGRTTSVREFVAMAFRVAGVDIAFSGEGCDEKGYVVTSPEGCAVRAGDVVVEISPEHFRPAEVDLLVGDASKAFKKFGWKPKTSLEQLVQTMVEADCHH